MDDEEDERAIYTSDNRPLASPQAKHRKVSAAAELAETKQRLEAVALTSCVKRRHFGDPRRLQGDSKETPRRLQGDSKETPRRLQGDSKETPRRLQGDSKETHYLGGKGRRCKGFSMILIRMKEVRTCHLCFHRSKDFGLRSYSVTAQ
eukprot:Skav226682  [mRNA]  locus=scaffold3971:34307:35404:- [translate_table: standard]